LRFRPRTTKATAGGLVVRSDGGAPVVRSAFVVGPGYGESIEAGSFVVAGYFAEDPRVWPPGRVRAQRIEAHPDTGLVCVTVRVKLRWVPPPEGLVLSFPTAAEREELMAEWKAAIEDAWSERYTLARVSGSCAPDEYTVRVAVDWVDSEEHIGTRIIHRDDPNKGDTEGSQRWFFDTSGAVAAHEFGHMLGYPDEYEWDPVPDDDSIMAVTGGEVRLRHYMPFALWLSEQTGFDYRPPDDPFCNEDCGCDG
jgi:hypothetical protein